MAVARIPSILKKPETVEVYKFLRKQSALIVHFSGAPKGSGVDRGPEHLFATDLQHIVNGDAMGGIACSVVKPGDVFHGNQRNAIGNIGIIVGLMSNDSLVAVDPHDCGSIENEFGERVVLNERDITISDLEITLDTRVTYNEWVIRNYTVLGVFVSEPRQVSILKVPDYPDDMPDSLRNNKPIPDFRYVALEELQQVFPDQPIYKFKGAYVYQRHYVANTPNAGKTRQ